MTHKDIYTKFMIEYDKANVTSSYPSLTEYEVATVLDKAYNALIAQKITGNNTRRIGFEMDLKSIEDLSPLIRQKQEVVSYNTNIAPNVVVSKLPEDCLYFLDAYLRFNLNVNKYETNIELVQKANCDFEITNSMAIDGTFDDHGEMIVTRGFYLNKVENTENIVLYTSSSTDKFKYNIATRTVDDESGVVDYSFGNTQEGAINDIANLLLNNDVLVWSINDESDNWIEVYSKDVKVIVSSSPLDQKNIRIVPTKLVTHAMASKFFTSAFNMPWIKVPVVYIEDGNLYIVYDLLNAPNFNDTTIVYIKRPNTFVKDLKTPTTGYITYFEGTGEQYQFECNSTVAEELISLAVTFALENVESQRLNSKLNMRGLEA